MAITATRKTTGAAGNLPSLVSMAQPEGALDRTIREINDAISRRAFELCQSRGFTHGNDWEDWLRAESELFRFVPVELVEDENELRVLAEVPGFNPKDITLQLDGNKLVIRGKSEQVQERHRGNVSYSERQGSEIFRIVHLPAEVDSEKANAIVRDGVLELTLPKSEHAKSKRLQIKAA